MLSMKRIDAGEQAGKLGCFDGDNLVGTVEDEQALAAIGRRFTESEFAAFLTDVGIPKEAHSPEKLKVLLIAGEAAQKDSRAKESRRLLMTEVIVNGKVDPAVAANYLAEGKIGAEDFKAGIAAEKRVDGAIQAGKLLPRHRGMGIRLVLAETADFAPFKTLIEEGKPLVNLNPKGFAGSGSGSPTEDLRNLAKARAAEKNIGYGQALSEVSREHPDLARQHRAEVVEDSE